MTVEYSVDKHVALVRINRPDRLNALGREVALGLAGAFTEAAASPDVRAIVLTGTGRAFSVGMDIKEHSDSGGAGIGYPDITPLTDPFYPFRSAALTKPVIAAVNGMALGAGFYLALNADLVVASEDAVFEVTEVHRGAVVGWDLGVVHGLTRPIATELALGGRLSAQRAYDVGLINEVTTGDAVVERALERAAVLVDLPPLAIEHNLALLHRVRPAVAPEIQDEAERIFQQVQLSEDSAEAMNAFLDRRQAAFRGI